jgi:hypothetical protein
VITKRLAFCDTLGSLCNHMDPTTLYQSVILEDDNDALSARSTTAVREIFTNISSLSKCLLSCQLARLPPPPPPLPRENPPTLPAHSRPGLSRRSLRSPRTDHVHAHRLYTMNAYVDDNSFSPRKVSAATAMAVADGGGRKRKRRGR